MSDTVQYDNLTSADGSPTKSTNTEMEIPAAKVSIYYLTINNKFMLLIIHIFFHSGLCVAPLEN